MSKTALITGGSTGIGAALARQWVQTGGRAMICARRLEPMAALQRELGDALLIEAADLTDASAAAAVVAKAEAELGALDMVVANAGMSALVRTERPDFDRLVKTIQLNVTGACATLLAAAPAMRARGTGRLVGISSLAAYRGMPQHAVYCASKAALSTFLEGIRIELRGTGVKVIDIRPGFIDTPLTQKNRFPMPFMMTAEDGARRILRAIEANRAVYAFPWQLGLGLRLMQWLPAGLFDPLVARFAP